LFYYGKIIIFAAGITSHWYFYMRKCNVYMNDIFAGVLTELSPREYEFEYCDEYFNNDSLPQIGLSLSKANKKYQSRHLFPLFANILSEGHNRKMQASLLHIDENDDFGILLETAQYDTIGAITVKPIQDDSTN